jgi:serine/threonine protein kinase
VNTDSQKLIVMELMECSLYDVLRTRKLSVAEQLKCAQDICKGMYYLASLDPPVYHRDLKSHNLLIGDRATFSNIKLTDFGLSRVKTFTMSSISKVGTPQWSAPEVLNAEENSVIDWEKADVYSFGGLN